MFIVLKCHVIIFDEKINDVKFFSIVLSSYKVWEINMGVCQRSEFDNIMFNNCLVYDFYIYGAFEFLCNSIAYLWSHV